MKTNKANSRRKFLVTAGLGGAGAAAVVATGLKGRTEVASPQAEKTAQGYRATEHIIKYYKTTEV